MKNKKMLAIIALVFLNIIAGYLVFNAAFGGTNKYDDAIKKAQSYREQKLYQKSIDEYNRALAIKDSPKICIEKIKTADEGIAYGELENSYDLQTELDSIIEKYYKNASIYEAVCQLCMKYENYEPCVKYLKQAKSQKAWSEKLDGVYEDIRYLYQNEYTMYENASNEVNGDYLVETNGMVSIIDAKGESVIPGKYLWATHFSAPVNSGDSEVKYAVVSKNDNDSKQINYIVDNTGKKQIYIDAQINGAYAPARLSSGKYIFPCHIGDKHYYYTFDPVTEKVEQAGGPYQFAGAYRNHIAAVKVAENKWQLLDENGKQIDSDFTDIVLNDAAECSPKGLILAAKGGKYQIIKMDNNGKLKAVDGFTCDGAKAFIDGTYAAFKSGDKWGFVSADGKILIDAKYADAHSFSQGMAAVSVDGLWKYINAAEKIVIDHERVDSAKDISESGFTSVNDFSAGGKCFVKDGDYWTSLQLYYVEDEK